MMGLPIKSRVTAPIATLKGFAKYVLRRTLTSSGHRKGLPHCRSQDTEFSQMPPAVPYSVALPTGTYHPAMGVSCPPACRLAHAFSVPGRPRGFIEGRSRSGNTTSP